MSYFCVFVMVSLSSSERGHGSRRAEARMETVDSGISLTVGLALTDLDRKDLWGRYLGLGGENSYPELLAYLAGTAQWSAHEHDVAAQALNEYFVERGMDHPVPYAADL